MDFKHQWLSNKGWWFPKDIEKESIDHHISSNYFHLIDDPNDADNVAKILIYDQLPRHCFRKGPNVHLITYFLQKALMYSLQIIESGSYHVLSDEELVFVLLPLRHTYDWSYIKLALKIMWERLQCIRETNKDSLIIKRFVKAAYSRAPEGVVVKVEPPCKGIEFNVSEFSDILVNQHLPCMSYVCEEKIFESFKAVLSQINPKRIIISLSGGVDSMICSHVLNKLREDYGFELIAVHINYTNKPTATKDESFAKAWCCHLGIPLHIRVIDEINRDSCMKCELRELYETYTRRVRFDTYICSWNLHHEDGDEDEPLVVLGHNKNDCFENILTNITHCQKYDNLLGMSPIMSLDGITFLRPLLHITKHEIRSFARSNNIPHLQDSTPSWSQRGRIRDIVAPTLNAWNSNCIEGLFELSDVVKDMYALLEIKVANMCQRTKDDRMCVSRNELVQNATLWKSYFARCHNTNVSKHSIKNFCERLKAWRFEKDLKVVLNKTCTVKVHSCNNDVVIIERL